MKIVEDMGREIEWYDRKLDWLERRVDNLESQRDRLREALSQLTSATKKEATYDDVVHRHLWLYIERAERLLQEVGDE